MKSIRKKDNNPAIPHVESPHYSGLCRRHHQNLPRVSCIEVCSIADHNPDTKAFIGKCTQIGPGGCRIILHEILNKSSIVMINFYKSEGDELVAGVPMTAKVAAVHHRKDGWYTYSLDFRGSLWSQHLIEDIMLKNIQSREEEKKQQKQQKEI